MLRIILLICALSSPALAEDRLGLVYDAATKELLSIINPSRQDTLDKPGFYTAEGQALLAVEKSLISSDGVVSTSQAQQYIRDHVQ